jgi:hypothetical protein
LATGATTKRNNTILASNIWVMYDLARPVIGRAPNCGPRADIIALAIQYGRYGYRRITALLRNAGWW